MSKRWQTATLILVLGCVPQPAVLANGLSDKQRGYLQQFAEVIAKVVQADKEMWTQLTIVSRQLDKFYFARGHFPQTDEEKELFRTSLLKYIKANPYKPRRIDLASYEQLPSEGPLNIQFLVEPSMNPQMVRGWVASAPPSWKADPGTIFCISNGTNYYALWATSADALPIRDLEHSSNKLKIIAHYCEQNPRH